MEIIDDPLFQWQMSLKNWKLNHNLYLLCPYSVSSTHALFPKLIVYTMKTSSNLNTSIVQYWLTFLLYTGFVTYGCKFILVNSPSQNLTHCGLVNWYVDMVNTGWGKGLLPDSTKPLLEPMLTYNQGNNINVNTENINPQISQGTISLWLHFCKWNQAHIHPCNICVLVFLRSYWW